MPRYEADFTGGEQSSVAIVDAAALSSQQWADLRAIQFNALEAQLPGNSQQRFERAREILQMGRQRMHQRYMESRIDTNSQAGLDGWNARQRFDRSRVAMLLVGNRVAGAVLSVNSVSGSDREMTVKRHLPPFHYLHLREAYVDPDLHRVQTDREERTVSGLVVAGVHHTLLDRNWLNRRFQNATTYVVEGDAADAEMEGLAAVLGMRPNPTIPEVKPYWPGYPENTPLTRMQATVRDMLVTTRQLPGAADALADIPVLYELPAAAS